MRKTILFIGVSLVSSFSLFSQQPTDSLKSLHLKEVTITAKTGLDSINESKPLSSIDEHLEKLSKLNLIKRGGYAWEPTINNMATERISVTIDGMKIFCACTDRMDPVTSYVEVPNLDNILVGSGISGNTHGTNSIGGSLDLKLIKAGFHARKLNVSLNSAYETNGNSRMLGSALAYSSFKFYTNTGVFYRKSDNYTAGGGGEVSFSQFEKLNLFSNWGYRLAKNQIIEGTVIYDIASNVGYPALTMDVKSAKGLITSLSYRKENVSNVFSNWETKVYYNNIVHIMDDTKRPNVAMHMDMPGWSRTGGYYSTLNGRSHKHNFVLSHDTYYNQSLAEMTMYPSNPTNKTMFMYTWPDIRTLNTGFTFDDKYMLNTKNTFQLTAKTSFQRDGVESTFGYNTLRMYYPEMPQFKNRLLWNVNGKYTHYLKDIQLKIGAGYGTRAPSPTEAYGFYLFNSFDNYDYIGNPQLKNESSFETNFSLTVTKRTFNLNLDASYFYFNNYIIGKPQPTLSSMSTGSSGVKVYENLNHATIFNIGLKIKQNLLRYLNWTNYASYSLGQDNQHNALPLISPLSYFSSISFVWKKFSSEIKLQGAGKQYEYSSEYGEDQTPAYLTLNASAGYDFTFKKYAFEVKTGIENIFDKKYSTYSDWNNIPRKGRNFYVSIRLNI